MLNIAKKTGGAGAMEYYLTSVKGQGWYEASPDGGPRGRWNDPHGLLAPWGIRHGDLIDDDGGRNLVRRLARGYAPTFERGIPLARNAGSPRRVVGIDRTFSSPKTPTLVWAGVTDDSPTKAAIELGLREAAHEARTLLERLGGVVRRGKGGLIERPGLFCGASFLHADTRFGDPSIHLHDNAFTPGLDPAGLHEEIAKYLATWGEDPDHDTVAAMAWHSCESRRQLQLQKLGGAAFRVALADRLETIGFQVVPRSAADWAAPSPHGLVGGGMGEKDPGALFDVAGVSRELVEQFSRRCMELRAHIDAARRADPDAIINEGAWTNARNKATRKPKSALAPEGFDWRGAWHERLARSGFGHDEAEACARLGGGNGRQRLTTAQVAEAAEADLLTHEHIHAESAVWTTVMAQALGRADLRTAVAAGEALIEDGVLKRLPTPEHDGSKSYYMPRQLDQEREVAALAVTAQDTLDPMPEPIVKLAAQRLRQIGSMPDAVAQTVAKRALGADGVVCVEGGSGVADALRAAFKLEGGGAEVTVVEQAHALPFGVIAEAVMAREEAGSRLILVGANTPVDPGRPSGFNTLSEALGLSLGEPTARLLHAQGQLVASGDAVEEAAERVLQAALNKGKRRDVAVVVPSRTTADAVNARVREKLRAYGVLKADIGVAQGERGPMPLARGDLVRLPDGAVGKITYAEADPNGAIVKDVAAKIVWPGSRNGTGDTVIEKTKLLRHAWADMPGGITPSRRADMVVAIADHRATANALRTAWRLGSDVTVLADPRLLGDDVERRKRDRERARRREQAEIAARAAVQAVLRGGLADRDEAALAREIETDEPDQVLRAVAELARRRDVTEAVLLERTLDAAQVVSAARARPAGALAEEVETAAVAALSRLHPQSLLARLGELRFHSLSGQGLTYVAIEDPELDPDPETPDSETAELETTDPDAEATERGGEALGLRLRKPSTARERDA